jgi:peptide/nickel transport system substrate-binding protein
MRFGESRDMHERLVSRRMLLGMFAAGTGSLALTGCGVASAPAAPAATSVGPTSVSPTASSSAPTAKPAGGQPKSGGVLRAGIVGDLPGIDGQQSLPGINATVGNAYEQLTRYDANLTPQPVLAESWDFSADGTQIKVNLRKGA